MQFCASGFCPGLLILNILEGHGQRGDIFRPGVAGAVLQTPPSLIDTLTYKSWFVEISSTLCNSWPDKDRDYKCWHKVPDLLRVMCHMSHFLCYMSPVTCQLKKSGGASLCRVCYQRGPTLSSLRGFKDSFFYLLLFLTSRFLLTYVFFSVN